MKDLSNESIIHICKENIQYIQFRKLLEYPDIIHGYTLRKEGTNFRTYENDIVLQESYKKIANIFNFEMKNIVKPHQTHTDKVEIVNGNKEKFNEVDGLITNKKNIVLCTTEADCTGLIFYDYAKKVIANVHSGWRGTVKKIGQKAVLKMIKDYNCSPENIVCCICPHIRQCHFEVDEDVMKIFEKEFSYTGELERIIKKGRVVDRIQKYNINTTLINKLILKEVNLKEENIIDSGICTVCEADSFHSYRVDKQQSGRNATFIGLKN